MEYQIGVGVPNREFREYLVCGQVERLRQHMRSSILGNRPRVNNDEMACGKGVRWAVGYAE